MRGGSFASLCAVGFLARVSYSLARTPVLALFAAALGAGPEAIGLAVASSTVTGVFFKMPAGVFSDVMGRKRTLFLGLAFFAFAPLGYLGISSYPALVAIRFLHGFATAIYSPVAMAVVAGVSGGRRAEMLSWFSSITIIGNLLGAPLGGFLVTRLSGGAAPRIRDFHIIYGVVLACGLASLVTAWLLLRGWTDRAPPATGRTLRAVLSQFRAGAGQILMDRRVLLASNLEGVQNLSVGALEAFLPIYAVRVRGFSAFQAGLLWGIQILVTILAKPMLGRWSDRRGRQAQLFWGMFVCAVPFALIPWFASYSVLLTLVAVYALGEAVVTSCASALVADLCREEQLGSAMGVFGTVYDVGHASGPLLAGALIGLTPNQDFRPGFGLIAALLAVAALAFRLV